MAVQIQQRGDTASNWSTSNPTLADREIGWETDTRKFKLGNGVDPWAALPYASNAGAGDVVGPGSSTDNTLARYDGTTGKIIQGSGVSVTDNNEISGYRGDINAQTGTSYTLLASDAGRVIDHANSSAITVTLPNNLPQGFCLTYLQAGAGQITFSPASGASLRNYSTHTKTAGQWAAVTLWVRANPGGSSAEYVLAGATGA